MSLAPVVVFIYNRPEHTRKTLEALAKNDLFDASDVIVYADAAKSENDKPRVEETRNVVKQFAASRRLRIVEREQNLGLAESIISGVTEVVEEYGRVIVLEDDLVTSKKFLKFMNDSLAHYAEEDRVMHVSGYVFPFSKQMTNHTFFTTPTSCWGWGTWQRSWNHFEKDANKFIQVFSKSMIREFNLGHRCDYWRQMRANANGQIDTWAIFWHASVFLNRGLSLHPVNSLVNNIGHDGTGTHCNATGRYAGWLSCFDDYLYPDAIEEDKHYSEHFAEFLKNETAELARPGLVHLPRRVTRKAVRLIGLVRDRFDPNPAGLIEGHKFLYKVPRYQPQEIKFLGQPFKLRDAASFIHSYAEIFGDECYKFNPQSGSPRILDVGANMGLASLYFKQAYPNAHITAFEADPTVYSCLEYNTKHLSDFEIINKAVFNKETVLEFNSEGADAGRLHPIAGLNQEKTCVETCLLSNYLQAPVDFLKIDIEGAETVVLKECAGDLKNVYAMFVEYHSFSDAPQSLHELLKILKDTGFRYHITKIVHCAENPFIDMRDNIDMDLQINICCLR